MTAGPWWWIEAGAIRGTYVLAGQHRRHGERRTYQAGCTCDQCRAANARYQRQRRRRLAGEPCRAA